MDENLLKAYSYANYNKTIKNQLKLLKLKLEKRLKIAHKGGLFKITPDFIVHVKSYVDQGFYRGVFLDMYENPIEIENLEQFFNEILEREKLIMNEYYVEYKKIAQIRSLEEFIDE